MDQRFDFEPGMEMRMTELPQPRAASPDGSSSRDADIVSAGNVSAPVRNAGITRLETDNAEIPPIKPLLLVICPLMLKLAILHFYNCPGMGKQFCVGRSLLPAQFKVVRHWFEIFSNDRCELVLRIQHCSLPSG